ncbi:MAG TPA: APC family permease [Candidatus Saccharimonadales bacterium]|jgi:APA family basic amino acid/polyamine antiporter|nr:APC family permease [Candidatus Saccharimonadales bacterium]
MQATANLDRDIGLREATALNMIDMIGVGPFITIPLIVHAMGGPQAMIGWVVGAFLAICDGLVWAELGAALPRAGGSYQYLKESYGAATLGRLMSFLFVWQLIFSAPLSIASGCIGVARYAAYLWPGLDREFVNHTFSRLLPLLGKFEMRVLVTGGTFVAMGTCVLAVLLLYRRIAIVARMSKFLWVGVMATVLLVIAAGLSHFSAARAFSFPAHAFDLNRSFALGLGAALLVATYDYWGYYNICFLGAEVRAPERTIPRALIYSILLVAAIYIVMNISILGVIPWQELNQTATSESHFYVASTLLQRTFGPLAGKIAAVLIIWTAFASVFSLMLGYSRVPYAAAVDGNYFRRFARLHPQHHFPHVSLLTLGFFAAIFCLFRLQDVIAALVVIRIMVQFLMQILGLFLLRARRPDFPRPFRMYLYPIPAVLAAAGFLYVVFERPNFVKEIRYALVIVAAGLVVFFFRSWRRKEWPFGLPAAHESVAEPVQ